MFLEEIRRMASNPTGSEIDEEVDKIAREILNDL